MKLSLETPATPAKTDANALVLEGALRKFLAGGFRISVLYTRGKRQTLKFTGLLENEAFALVQAGLARAVRVDPDQRFRVTLTPDGNRARGALARKLEAETVS